MNWRIPIRNGEPPLGMEEPHGNMKKDIRNTNIRRAVGAEPRPRDRCTRRLREREKNKETHHEYFLTLPPLKMSDYTTDKCS